MRPQARHDADGEVALARQRADGGGDGAGVVSSHCVQIANRLAWQLGQKSRHLQEKMRYVAPIAGGEGRVRS
jgi:hypothetical protein